jgi:NDP-sugar pyrophosphorylase family protein
MEKRPSIVIPLAGLGSRFESAGFIRPKPLIDLLGRPIYSWSVDSLPLSAASKLIFVLRSDQRCYAELRDDIVSRYGAFSPIIVTIDSLSRGQADSCLAASELLDQEQPLLIHNGDTGFTCSIDISTEAIRDGCDGALLVFQSDQPRWSYSREGRDGLVEEVREKEVVSQWASCGTYWFRSAGQFTALAKAALSRPSQFEVYVGPLYNELCRNGGRVKNYQIRELFCFGTPEDLYESESRISAVYDYFGCSENLHSSIDKQILSKDSLVAGHRSE